MSELKNRSRREFMGTAALGAMAGAGAAVFNPGRSAAQAVGVKVGDLPIKEVKVYHIQPPNTLGVTNRGYNKIAAIVTNSGIEGNYTLANRYFHPNWSNFGWLDYAKPLLVGKSVLDLPALTSNWHPRQRRTGQSSYHSAIDCCLWDILGKAVNLPIYRVLGAYRDKVRAYASSRHHRTIEEFVTEVKRCKEEGFTAYKVHPPSTPAANNADYRLDMEVLKAVRQAAGDDFTLLHDPVGVYSREEAIKVGRLCQDLNFVAYEDPIPTTDIDGLVELCDDLDIPIHIGEFIFSIYDYPEYIRRRALDVVRIIVDNVGGITGAMKVCHLAECFGMEVVPHNWGEIFDHAVHFHVELAMPNCIWFEMTVPQGSGDRPYMKDTVRIAKDGYVYAPTKPGIGYEIDRDVLERMIVSIER